VRYTLIGIALVFVSSFLICWWLCSEALRKGFGGLEVLKEPDA
jgi:hypothetical protein